MVRNQLGTICVAVSGKGPATLGQLVYMFELKSTSPDLISDDMYHALKIQPRPRDGTQWQSSSLVCASFKLMAQKYKQTSVTKTE